MDVSVVIPAHNEEKYIERAIRSIHAQTVVPCELIVVDNCCTDRTPHIAQTLGARVVVEKKKGIVHARNAGFDAAKGDVIARIDADTQAAPDWIKRITEHVAQGKEALTGMIHYDIPLIRPQMYDVYQELARLLFGHYVYTGLNMIITKNLWRKCRPLVCLNEKIAHEDLDLSIVAAEFATLYYERDVVVYTSSRRIVNNPKSFFIEYQLRGARQLLAQKKRLGERKTREFRESFHDGFQRGMDRTDRAIGYLLRQIDEATELGVEMRQKLSKLLIDQPRAKIDSTLAKLITIVKTIKPSSE
jgi:glycosyltransferase involved in cell wall biosynthesis